MTNTRGQKIQMTRVDFKEIYRQIATQERGTQKRIELSAVLGIYVGFNRDGNIRLSFLSSLPSSKFESTKLLKVIQSVEKKNSFWISFELLDANANDEFFTFCENMIDAVVDADNEQMALSKLKRRYLTWRSLFQRNNAKTLSREILQGIYGELYYLSNCLIPTYGAETAISSWCGPDAYVKDFTIENTWFEIKTIGSTVDRIHVSSVSQLDSDVNGHLIVIRVEAVSPEYKDENCKLSSIVASILQTIEDDTIEDIFTQKLNSLGIDVLSCSSYNGFKVISLDSYLVDATFPRISRKDIAYEEIIGIQYDLSLASIQKHKE